MWFSAEIKMRCWQANVEITRPANLCPALWSLCHQMLPEPSIKVMKCNILKWHNHRAKSSLPWRHWWHIMRSNEQGPLSCYCIYHTGNIWVPAGVVVLTRLGFTNNTVMVSVNGNAILLTKPNFTPASSQHSSEWDYNLLSSMAKVSVLSENGRSCYVSHVWEAEKKSHGRQRVGGVCMCVRVCCLEGGYPPWI